MTTKKKKKRRLKKETRLLIRIVLTLLFVIGIIVGYELFFSGGSKGSKIRIVLDSAHGGDGSGAQGLFSEDEYNEQVVTELEALLSSDSRFEVSRTHAAAQPMNAQSRVEVINSASPDAVISVGCYTGDSPNIKNTAVFAQPAGVKSHKDSAALAAAVVTAFSEKGYDASAGYYYFHPEREGLYQEHIVPLEDETDYQEDTFILLSAKAPVIIVWQANVNSQEDMDKWNNEAGVKEAAKLYYQALKAVYGK